MGLSVLVGLTPIPTAAEVDFNTDIRSILSEHCYRCHGPDAEERKGGLRLDTSAGATADLGGYAAIVPHRPDESELLARVTHDDPDDRMPPADSGRALLPEEVTALRRWISGGAEYSTHWAYVPPVKPALPRVSRPGWPRNAIDHFVLARLDREGLEPSPPAPRPALIRRVSLDLTGLPPTPEEVEAFVRDDDPGAYQRLLGRLFKKQSFGEHWARFWLDQARYADSAGYADDPPRTIWAFRDYVIRSLNANKPFDQFTVEQIAGDLLSDPSEEQLIATAFHRNTLTNNEGGTNDEEYRNVAIVDRVNTTMEVWMGTTMACAQCHTHKYDPITQEDYFRFFAILNNTADADRRNEQPVLELYTTAQKEHRRELRKAIEDLNRVLHTSTPEIAGAQEAWERIFTRELHWQTLHPATLESQAGASLSQTGDGVIEASRHAEQDAYTAEITLDRDTTLTALQLEALPDPALPGQGPGHAGGNFVLSGVRALVTPPASETVTGRYVRITIPGDKKILSLAEVQVFAGADNIARQGEARQSSTAYNGPAGLAIDGNTDGNYAGGKSTTHTATSRDPWWELDLKTSGAIDRIVLWNRTDNGLQSRLKDFRVILLDEHRQPVWETFESEPPDPSREYSPGGTREIRFAAAFADHEQKGFGAANVLRQEAGDNSGWAVGGALGQSHQLVLVSGSPANLPSGSLLTIHLEQRSKHAFHTLGKFRLSYASDPHAPTLARTPAPIRDLLRISGPERTEEQRSQIREYYLSITPLLEEERDLLAARQKELEGIKPYTTVPIMRELPGEKHRSTRIQRRGNFLDTGKEVRPGLPDLFPEPPDGAPLNRLGLARWLVDRDNPLTARVMVNRFWGSIFGMGIVPTSEEFGSQGDLPSHPGLLDWLAVDWMEQGWDLKALLRTIVSSATYRQSSRVTPALLEKDPDNRLLARGPRFRMSAEMIRDQALFVSGLLSQKMHGPPVKPFQPKLGVNAAFGGGIDWTMSQGEDQYRRGVYTLWRRSNPYPSMATFDAPTREVCVVKRSRTNTPLQALVTLNDPVYVEAAQALGRRMAQAGPEVADRVRHGFMLCLARPPRNSELSRLVELYQESQARFAQTPDQARVLATQPLGAAPEGSNVTELAAWTVVANVLLNLDETLMKR